MDDRSFWADGGRIVRPDYEYGEAEYTVDEAREMLAELTAAIAECEQQAADILAACADGHDWGELHNGWHVWPDTKVCTRYCRRPGCDGREELPGWVEFAGRLHHDPVSGRRVECYGPGCEPCCNEKLAVEINQFLADGLAVFDQAVLGSALQKDPTAERTTDG